MTFTLAWRNLRRHSRRSLFSVLAIAAASVVVVFLPSLQAGSYAGMIRTYAGLVDGYAQIQDPKYLDTPAIRDSFAVGPALRKALERLPQGVSFAERGVAYALLSSSDRSIGAQILGVEPRAEPAVSTIPSSVFKGRYLEGGGDLVLGEALARNLRVDVGDRVTVLGVGRDGSLAADALTVAGIFRTGATDLDRTLAEMPLDRFDATFAMGGARHAVVVNGRDAQLLRAAVSRLRPSVDAEGLALRDWTQLQPGLYSAIELDITGGVLMYAVLIAVVVASLLNTLLMSVLERTREFGVMLALGVRPGVLSRIVWEEIGLVAVIGAATGMGLGAALTAAFRHEGIRFESAQAIFRQYGMSATLHPELTPLTLLAGPAVIVLAILVAGAFPALRIHRLRIIESMRAA